MLLPTPTFEFSNPFRAVWQVFIPLILRLRRIGLGEDDRSLAVGHIAGEGRGKHRNCVSDLTFPYSFQSLGVLWDELV